MGSVPRPSVALEDGVLAAAGRPSLAFWARTFRAAWVSGRSAGLLLVTWVAGASGFLPSAACPGSLPLLALGAILGGTGGAVAELVLRAGAEHCVAGTTSSSSLSEELPAVLSEAWTFLPALVAWAWARVAAGPAGLRLGSTKIRGVLITWLAGSSSSLLAEGPSAFSSLAFFCSAFPAEAVAAGGLPLAGLQPPPWAGGASPSLPDDSSLLLSESSVGFPAWVAGGPVFPAGAGAAPFLGEALLGAEAALTWGVFLVGFACAGAASSLSESPSLLSESSSAPPTGPGWGAAVVAAFPTAGTAPGPFPAPGLPWGVLAGGLTLAGDPRVA